MKSIFLPLFISCFLLSALSISNLGMISSMVAFLHTQKNKVETYPIEVPNHGPDYLLFPTNILLMNVLPKHLWVDHGHASNGVAGYGFFLGLFGMVVALRHRKRTVGKEHSPATSLHLLTILLVLATLFTLAVLISVFVITDKASGHHINPGMVGPFPYDDGKWTPETWFKAVLELPLKYESQRVDIRKHVRVMSAWRWMLVPIFMVDVVAAGVAVWGVRRQRNAFYTPEEDVGK